MIEHIFKKNIFISAMSVQSTLLRPTPKIANYSSYWVCVSARRGFSASPQGVRPASPLTRLEKKEEKRKKRNKSNTGVSPGNSENFYSEKPAGWTTTHYNYSINHSTI